MQSKFNNSLTAALIEQSGGLQTFEANYKKLLTQKDAEGWEDSSKVTDFYAAHKADIFETLMNLSDDVSMVEYVSNLELLDSQNYLNLDRVAEGMHNSAAEPHVNVATVICKKLLSELAIHHSMFGS
ncbi:MAG: hypothetical protein VYA60_11000 [Pseudomonadota bacterium]|nr:hypothetical protein [Pseudomonadota bacterium]